MAPVNELENEAGVMEAVFCHIALALSCASSYKI